MSKAKRKLIEEKLRLYKSSPSIVKKEYGWTQKQYDEQVALLEKQLEQSKRGRRSKTKGSTYERTVAKKIKDKIDVELVRTPMSGGFKKDIKATNIKGDISNLDESVDFRLHVECKDQVTWKLKDWLDQASEECPEGHIPVVVFHREQKNSEPCKLKGGKLVGVRLEEAQDYITIKLDDFLDIVDRDKIVVPKKVVKKQVRKKVK